MSLIDAIVLPMAAHLSRPVRVTGRHRRTPGDLPRAVRVRTVRSHRWPKARPR
ncbi:hypothetical protein [Salinispora mooreana]|uniref:hypothetical protein n=1 Tax=Salinispora mooreana TaxID=999545 RepID=UPI0003A88F92|nr:hypothetical protein [Salinispora mooreana]